MVREMRRKNALDPLFALVPLSAVAGVVLQLRAQRRLISGAPSVSLVGACAVSAGLLVFYAAYGFRVEHLVAKEVDESPGSIQAPVIVAKTAWFNAALVAAIASLALAAFRRQSPRLLRQDTRLVISLTPESRRPSASGESLRVLVPPRFFGRFCPKRLALSNQGRDLHAIQAQGPRWVLSK